MKRSLAVILFLVTSIAAMQAALPDPVWHESARVGNTVFLLRKLPYQVMQYDLETQGWLEPFTLPFEPTAFTADETYFYVAFNRQVSRIRRSDGVSNHIANTAQGVTWIRLVGEYILIGSSQHYHIYTKDTLTLQGEGDYHYRLQGLSTNPVKEELFGRSSGVSPSDIHRMEVIEDGTRLSGRDSPYHGDFMSASRTWCFPDGNRVIDDSGTVYNTADLTYNGSVGTSFNCMDFMPDNSCIVLRDSGISSYDKWLRKNGQLEHPQQWLEVFINGDNIFGFHNDEASGNGVGVELLPLSQLELEPTAEVLDPSEIEFEIDDIAVGADGLMYLLSKNLYNIFVWSPETRDWLTSIPLRGSTDIIEYAPAINALYAYGARELSIISLDGEEPEQASFANVAWDINLVIPIEDHVFVSQNGSWDNQAIIDPTGAVIDSNFQCCYNRFYGFHPVTRRLYMDIGDMGYFPYLGDGILGDFVSGGYFSRYDYKGIVALSESGSLIILGDGNIISGETYSKLGVLSSNVQDAMWIGERLYTVENNNTGGYYDPPPTTTVLQSWNEYYVLQKTQPLAGSYQSSYVYGDTIVVLVKIDERYRFYVLDEELQLLYIQPFFELENNPLKLLGVGDTSVTLQWDLSSGDETEYNLQFYTDGEWTNLARVDAASESYLVEGLFSGRHYDFRLASLARTERREADARVEVIPHIHAQFNYPRDLQPGDLKLQKFDGSDWQELRSISHGTVTLTDEEFSTSDSISDFRFAYESFLTSVLSTPVESSILLHFNWLRSEFGNDGFRLSQYDPDLEQWDTLVEMDSGTFTCSIPHDPSIDRNRYRLQVLDGEEWNNLYNYQMTLEGSLDWSSEPDAPMGWRVEASYYEQGDWHDFSELSTEADGYDLRFVDVSYPNVEFRVLRLEDALGFTALEQVTWFFYCDISWSRDETGTVPLLQFRDTPESEWEDLYEYRYYHDSGQYTHQFQNPDQYPEYRLSEAVDIPEMAVGYVQFTTTMSIESTVLTGLNASDKAFHNQIILDWYPTLNATEYEVFRSDSTDFEEASQIATVDAAESASYVDENLPLDTLYYYWVRSSDGILHGMLSAWDEGSTAPWDEDGDGVPFPLEQYLGQDATGYDVFGRVVTLGFEEGKWVLHFPRSKHTGRHDFKLQWSSDLLTWHSDGMEFAEPMEQDNNYLEKVMIDAASTEPIYVRFLENTGQ